MADQATVRGAGRPGPSNTPGNGNGQGVVGSIAEFGNDIATLAELQGKLTALDFQESKAKATLPLAIVAVGLAVIVAALPVGLIGVANLLARVTGIALGWMMVLTAAVTIVFAGLIVFLSIRELGQSFAPMRRSREELGRNISWVRTVLLYSGRSYSRRG